MRTGSLLFGVALWTIGCSSGGGNGNATYDPETGRLKTIEADVNKNGRNDAVAHMDGTRILRIELDLDENGHVERWDFYGDNGDVEKVGLSRLNDGVMDAVAYYGADGALVRMQVSTQRDGTFDRTEQYEHGILVRSEDDTNGDGRPDKWDEYATVPGTTGPEREYAVIATAFDQSGSGRPERRFIYGQDGSIARVEDVTPTREEGRGVRNE